MVSFSGSRYVFWLPVLLITHLSFGQQPPASDSVLQNATLGNVIQYALQNQPVIKQSLIDEDITEQTIKSKLADWFPQLNFGYAYQHNFQVPSNVINGNTIRFGVNNTSSLQFTLKQNIFNPDVLLANRSKNDVRMYARQNTSFNKTELAANVAKAFYAVLATEQQIKVAHENINRLQTSLKISYDQYKAGLVDKIDYKRTEIALNNSKADLKTGEAALEARLQQLKSLIGYPENAQLDLTYDSLTMEHQLIFDTLQPVDFSGRIEYQLLQTERKLREANKDYQKWSYIPTLSANAAYNLNFQNNSFSKLYSQNFPNSYAGLSLSFPIFQGFKRVANNMKADLEVKRLDWDIINFKLSANTAYQKALATYKGYLADYIALKENIELAREVYDVVLLQYKSGIKSYIEVVLADAELRTARISYYNALYQVLSAKIDAEKELGVFKYN